MILDYATTAFVQAAVGEVTPSALSVTINAADWSNSSATESVTGVTSSSIVVVTAAPESYEDVMNSGVYCSAQGSGTLTFSALYSAPSDAVSMNVLIL